MGGRTNQAPDNGPSDQSAKKLAKDSLVTQMLKKKGAEREKAPPAEDAESTQAPTEPVAPADEAETKNRGVRFDSKSLLSKSRSEHGGKVTKKQRAFASDLSKEFKGGKKKRPAGHAPHAALLRMFRNQFPEEARSNLRVGGAVIPAINRIIRSLFQHYAELASNARLHRKRLTLTGDDMHLVARINREMGLLTGEEEAVSE